MAAVTILTPKRIDDGRGWFCETYNAAREAEHGICDTFVQDNQSYSRDKGTLRGIHFQFPPRAQAKLVRCLRGRIMDYVVDLRKDSPTFGQYVRVELSSELGKQLYVPIGFGHAFVTLEDDTEIAYKVSDFYAPRQDGGIAWNCPDLAIDWPFDESGLTLSGKDRHLPCLKEFDSPFAYDGEPLQLLTAD